MTDVNYALRADHEDFAGGSFAWGPGQQTFDVGEALAAGSGVISVPESNTLLIAVLDGYPALKRTSAAKAEEVKTEAELPSNIHEAKKDQLVTLAESRGLDATGTKDEIIARLQESDEARLADQEAAAHTGDEYDSLERGDLFDLAQSMSLNIKGDETEQQLRQLLRDNDQEGDAA